MKLLRKIANKVVDWTMVVMFFTIFLVVLVQIWCRYVVNSPLVWTEELSRMMFIWVSLLGWVLATRHDTHIRIGFIQERLPAPIQKFLTVLFKLCTIGFLLTLAWLGCRFAMATGRGIVTLPQIPMKVVYFSLPVTAALGIFYTIIDMIDPSSSNKATTVTPGAGGDTI